MSRQKGERAYGPYEHGKKWRVVIHAADGIRGHRSFESFKDAEEYKNAFASVSSTRTVAQALDEYLKATVSAKDNSNVTKRHSLRGILRLPAEDRLLVSLTVPMAQKLYRQRTEEIAVASHHNELGYARHFIKWCVEQGWLRLNPFMEVRPTGKPNRGKPKLRINESRLLYQTLIADESLQATAVLTAFLLAMRASEVVERKVSELDDDGRLFWITNGKSRAAEREIEIPEVLRQRLLVHTQGLGPNDYIFGSMTRQTLYKATVRLCAKAGVSKITPHGLRGSAATQRVRDGRGIRDVAEYVGHADEGRTLRQHYLGGGAEESARGRQLVELLGTDGDEPFPGLDTTDMN